MEYPSPHSPIKSVIDKLYFLVGTKSSPLTFTLETLLFPLTSVNIPSESVITVLFKEVFTSKVIPETCRNPPKALGYFETLNSNASKRICPSTSLT